MNGESYVGVGHLEKDSFVVGWAITHNGTLVRGLNCYKLVEKEGAHHEFSGVWTILPGDGKLYPETLTFIKR